MEAVPLWFMWQVRSREVPGRTLQNRSMLCASGSRQPWGVPRVFGTTGPPLARTVANTRGVSPCSCILRRAWFLNTTGKAGCRADCCAVLCSASCMSTVAHTRTLVSIARLFCLAPGCVLRRQ